MRTGGVGLRSLKEAINTTTPGGRLVFHVFAALAEFIREFIVEAPSRAWTPPGHAASASAARPP